MERDKERWKNEILASQISRQTAKEIVHTFYKIGQDAGSADTYAEAYNYERVTMNCVMNGDIKGLEKCIAEGRRSDGTRSQIGHLSDNAVRQALYMLVSCVTLTTRFAIAGGVSERDAYHLSDAYLQQADHANSAERIIELIPAAMRQFTLLVNKEKRKKLKSYPVAQSIRYIKEHLYSSIRLQELAEYCQVTPQYLSATFHKEMGVTVMTYIRQEKLKVAEQMLVLSDYSIQAISDILNFGTASAFCTQFKKQYGATPGAWRIQNINRISLTDQ